MSHPMINASALSMVLVLSLCGCTNTSKEAIGTGVGAVGGAAMLSVMWSAKAWMKAIRRNSCKCEGWAGIPAPTGKQP